MKRQNKKRGFTIIELVIVVAVIAILSAVLIPTFTGIIKKSRQSADEAAVRNMNTILASEVVDKPDDIFDVAKLLSENGFNTENGLFTVYKDRAFYWHKPTNQIVYVDLEDGAFDLVYPKEVEGFAKANCQALGTNIPTEVIVPTVASTNATVNTETKGATIPSSVDTIEELATWTLGYTGAKMYTKVNGAEKAGVAFSGNVKLTADLVLGGSNGGVSMNYNIGDNVTIDLNGFSIIQANAGTGQSVALFTIRNGGTLNIIDSSANKAGTIEVGNCAFQIDAGGVVNMYAGTIKVAEDRSNADKSYGTAIVFPAGGTFNLFGGVVDGTTALNDDEEAICTATAASVCNLFGGEVKGPITDDAPVTINVYETKIG